MVYEINTKFGLKRINVDRTSILIAHNGYGKTTLANELLKKYPNDFEFPILKKLPIVHAGNQYYITDSTLEFKFTSTEFIKQINLYKNSAIKLGIIDNKLFELFDLLLSTIGTCNPFRQGIAGLLNAQTTVNFDNIEKINDLSYQVDDEKLEGNFAGCIYDGLNGWGRIMSTSDISQDDDYTIDDNYKISWDLSYHAPAYVSDIESNVGEAEIALEDVRNFFSNFLNETSRNRCNVTDEILVNYFHTIIVDIFECNNDWSREFDLRNTLYSFLFPRLFSIITHLNSLYNSIISFTDETFDDLKTFISKSPVKNVKILGSKTIPIIEYSNLSMGERKWIMNIIDIIVNSSSSKILILDDPLDSMDSFYSSVFMEMLKQYNKSYLMLTHKSDVLRYGIENSDFNFYNFQIEEINIKKAKQISTKSINDIINSFEWEEVLLFLIFFRFIFKNNRHTIYSHLSNIASNGNHLDKVSSFKPIIIELSSLTVWNKKFAKYSNFKITSSIINKSNKSFEHKVIEKFAFKSKDEYLSAMRHITETEPLDLYLFDSAKI